MSTLRTVTMVVGAGYGGSYLYNNASVDSLKGLAADFLLRDYKRNVPNGLDARLDHSTAAAATTATTASLNALSTQVDRLSRDVQRAANRPVVVVSDGARDPSTLAVAGWTVVAITVGGVVYYFLVWRRGYSAKDLLWVSRAAFNSTIETMQASVSKVSASVAAVRRELTEKLQNIEQRVENVRVGLSRKIETEVADVKDAVDTVGRDVEGVQTMLQGVNDRMELLDGKLDTATNGIVALVRVVSSLAPENLPPNSAFSELRRFAELTASQQTAPHLASALPGAFMKKQICSTFAAAALDGATIERSKTLSPPPKMSVASLFSRRDPPSIPNPTSIS